MIAHTLLLIAVITIGGSFVQRVSGFGFGIFVMMFLPYLLPSYGEATTLSGLLACTTALLVLIQSFRSVQWRKLFPVFLTYAITSIIAIEFLAGQSNELLKKLLGGVLILLSLYFIILSKRIQLRASIPAGLTVGAFSGIMGGLFAMPGPPMVVYLIQAIKDKKEYLVSMQAASVLFNMYATIFRAKSGFLTIEVGYGWLVGLLGVAVGMWLGSKVFNRISRQMLRYIVYAIMFASGIIALV